VKDAIDSLSSVVPGGVASGGIGVRSSGRERRPDRPLRKTGAAILAQVPLFASLSKRHLRKLAEHADEVDYGATEVVVEADDPGGTFYIILQGQAKVTRKGKTIATLEPGDFFGEISLLDSGPRTATVTAETPVKLLGLTQWSFKRLVEQNPAIASKMLKVMAQRLRSSSKDVRA
jgi:CRP/FNR family transcriptional regulator, cyclic AMP receptor protein